MKQCYAIARCPPPPSLVDDTCSAKVMGQADRKLDRKSVELCVWAGSRGRVSVRRVTDSTSGYRESSLAGKHRSGLTGTSVVAQGESARLDSARRGVLPM